jgi:hypothetical protein
MSACTFCMIHRKPFRMPRRAAAAVPGWLCSLGRATACVVAVAALSTLWVWRPSTTPIGIGSLSVEQRVVLYERTRENLELLCEPRTAPELETYCREQARILLHIPECDEGCVLLVRDQLGWATR